MVTLVTKMHHLNHNTTEERKGGLLDVRKTAKCYLDSLQIKIKLSRRSVVMNIAVSIWKLCGAQVQGQL
jgi:hypothetical protein